MTKRAHRQLPAPFVSAYTAKRCIVAPRTALRRRWSHGLDPYARALLEAQYYRPTMYRFMRALAADPEMLVSADLDERSTVVDAGAHVGEWAQQIGERYGCRILAFEPSPRTYDRAAKALREHNAVLLPYALGAADSRADLVFDGPGSSLFQQRGRFGAVEVDVRDVAGVFEELQIEHLDLLKLNIEGGEYDVFDRLSETGWLPKTRLISVQFHEWHPNAYRRRRQIRNRLRRTHVEEWCYPWVWEFWRRRE